MTTIAIPTFGSRVSSRTDCADTILLVKVKDGEIKQRETIHLSSDNPLERMIKVIQLHPDVMICGGLSDIYTHILNDRNIEVVQWVFGEVDDILSQYLEGHFAGEEH